MRTLTSRTARTMRRPVRCGCGAGLDRERHGLGLAEVVGCPQSVEQLEPEVPAQRRLDDLAVALPESGGSDLHRAEHLGIDRQGRAHLRHHRIIASRCNQVAWMWARR